MTDPNAAGPSVEVPVKSEVAKPERPLYTVEEECFDNVKAETKSQITELLLSEQSQKGWPTAVHKHGFDCWLRREGGDQRELVRKWLPHNVWRSVFIVVEDQVTAIALLCHNDEKPSAVLLTFLAAKRFEPPEEDGRPSVGGWGRLLLHEVVRRFHEGNFNSICSYSGSGKVETKQLVIETGKLAALGEEHMAFLHRFYQDRLAEIGVEYSFCVEETKRIWTIFQELVQQKRRRKSLHASLKDL